MQKILPNLTHLLKISIQTPIMRTVTPIEYIIGKDSLYFYESLCYAENIFKKFKKKVQIYV